MPTRLDTAVLLQRFRSVLGDDAVTRRDAVAAGFRRTELDALVRAGLLVREHRGILRATGAPGTAGTDAEGREDVRRRALAALACVQAGAVASHEAAAVLHGLPLPARGVPVICAVRPGAINVDGADLRLRGSALPEHRRATVDGVPVTSLVRTAIDVARGRSLPSALVVLDAALRRLIADDLPGDEHALRRTVLDVRAQSAARSELAACLAEEYGWPGTLAVKAALPLARASSESPAESVSRAWFLQASLGHLGPGTPVTVDGRTYWADFCDPDRRVIGEVDGWSKYGSDSDGVRRELTRERERQRALEDAGWRVVRWSITEGRAAVVQRVARALGRM